MTLPKRPEPVAWQESGRLLIHVRGVGVPPQPVVVTIARRDMGGIGERESCPLGTRTSIVVVASGSTVFKIVLVLMTWPAHSDVDVTYLRTTVFVMVENAVTMVLSKVEAFPIVMGMSNGNGVSVVFEVI